MEPKLITGNRIFDNRGSVRFNNNLILKILEDFILFITTKKILLEHGMVILKRRNIIGCIKGTFQISAVKIDNKNKPNKKK